MQVFTSVTANYLPKARVLAASVKKFFADARFHLVICDRVPPGLRESPAPFDAIIHVEELPIENIASWIFQHTLVELCTAVKGEACRLIMERHPHDSLLYFDPDIVVLAPLTDLVEALGRYDLLLTPHQLEPEETTQAIIDNEICSLKHGVFNLGFLGLAPRVEGRRFVQWWRQRLLGFCQADFSQGLFTDQRWVDLAPAFFSNVGILRDPGYNVATWNLTHRKITGTVPWGLKANGRPLGFFHFSGFDSGAQKIMLDRYGRQSPALYDLRRWYIDQCRQQGQDELGSAPWAYGSFDNGQPITDDHRRLYRNRQDLQQAFPHPAATADVACSYYHWYDAQSSRPLIPREPLHAPRRAIKRQDQFPGAVYHLLDDAHATNRWLQRELTAVQQQLEVIRHSRVYRAARRVSALVRGRWRFQD